MANLVDVIKKGASLVFDRAGDLSDSARGEIAFFLSHGATMRLSDGEHLISVLGEDEQAKTGLLYAQAMSCSLSLYTDLFDKTSPLLGGLPRHFAGKFLQGVILREWQGWRDMMLKRAGEIGFLNEDEQFAFALNVLAHSIARFELAFGVGRLDDATSSDISVEFVEDVANPVIADGDSRGHRIVAWYAFNDKACDSANSIIVQSDEANVDYEDVGVPVKFFRVQGIRLDEYALRFLLSPDRYPVQIEKADTPAEEGFEAREAELTDGERDEAIASLGSVVSALADALSRPSSQSVDNGPVHSLVEDLARIEKLFSQEEQDEDEGEVGLPHNQHATLPSPSQSVQEWVDLPYEEKINRAYEQASSAVYWTVDGAKAGMDGMLLLAELVAGVDRELDADAVRVPSDELHWALCLYGLQVGLAKVMVEALGENWPDKEISDQVAHFNKTMGEGGPWDTLCEAGRKTILANSIANGDTGHSKNAFWVALRQEAEDNEDDTDILSAFVRLIGVSAQVKLVSLIQGGVLGYVVKEHPEAISKMLEMAFGEQVRPFVYCKGEEMPLVLAGYRCIGEGEVIIHHIGHDEVMYSDGAMQGLTKHREFGQPPVYPMGPGERLANQPSVFSVPMF